MKRILYLLVMLPGIVAVQAQTLDECRRLAREHYPEIRQYELVSKTEEYNISNAKRAWIPQVVLSGQATYQSATPTYPEAFSALLKANGIENAGVRKDQYKLALDINQNIWDGGVSQAQTAVAKSEAEEQRRSLDVSLYEVESRVDNLYFGILLLDEQVAQIETKMALLDSNLSKMKAYYNNGVAMQSDVDAVEVEQIAAGQTLEQIKASRAGYRRMLELFIGRPLTDEKLQRPVLELPTNRTSARPELELFDARIGKLQAQKKSVNTSIMPRFNAFAQGYYGYPGLDMFKSMTSSEWTLNGIVGVRMSWNIGAFYTRNNNLQSLDAAANAVAVQRDVFLFNTDLQLTQDDSEIVRLRKAIADDERIVALRRSVREAAEVQMENGVIDTTDLLRKITDETRASLARSVHEIELLQAICRIKHTLNQ